MKKQKPISTDEKKPEDIFAIFFANSIDMLCVTDQEGRIIKVNPYWEKSFGYPNSELSSRSIVEYIHPEDIEKVHFTAKQLTGSQVIKNLPIRFRHKNGTYRWIEWCSFSAEGMICISSRDITDRQKVEEDLRFSEHKYRSIYENSSVGIALVDMKGKYLMVNNALCDIMGYNTTELLNLSFLQLTHPEDVELSDSSMQNLIKGKGDVVNFLKRYIHKNGSIIWTEISSRLICDQKNDPLYFVTHIKDITERKKAEEALRKSQEQLNSIAQNIQGMFFQFTIDKNGKYGFNYISERSLKYFGLEDKDPDTLFDDFVARIVREDQPRFLSSIKTAIEFFSQWEYEGRLNKSDGNELYFRGVAKPRMLDNTMVFDGFLLDITESKMTQIELDKTKAMFSTAFELTPIPMLIVSPKDYIVLMANKACLEFLGIQDESEYIGRSLLNINRTWQNFDEHGNPVPFSELPIILALKGIETKNKEIFIKRHDGSIRWQSVSSSTVRDNEGAIISAYQVFPDITEKKKIEKQIADERNTLRALIDNIPDLVYVKDLECRFVIVNKTLANVSGRSAESMIGISDLEVFPDELSTEFYADDSELMKTGIPIVNKEEKIFDTQGNTIVFSTSKSPLRDSNGVIIGLVGTGHIITERKLVEDKIRMLNTELEAKVEERTTKLNQALTDLEAFAYSISHDLRAPIRHIDGFTKLLYSKIADPSKAIINYQNKIEATTRHMSAMIDSLISFLRLGRTELNISEVDVESVVNEVINQYKPNLGERQIKWKISNLPLIKCDKNLIEQVFENLISNAIKYTFKRKKAIIEIGSGPGSKGQHEFFIKDNGIGFDMAYAGKLFGVFQKLHASDEYEGIGIGLAIVRQIIIKHGGTIRAEGKVNKGATFYITLP